MLNLVDHGACGQYFHKLFDNHLNHVIDEQPAKLGRLLSVGEMHPPKAVLKIYHNSR